MDFPASMAVTEPHNNIGAAIAGQILILEDSGASEHIIRRLRHTRTPGPAARLHDSGGTAQDRHRRQPRANRGCHRSHHSSTVIDAQREEAWRRVNTRGSPWAWKKCVLGPENHVRGHRHRLRADRFAHRNEWKKTSRCNKSRAPAKSSRST